jgi:hypothetical protein
VRTQTQDPDEKLDYGWDYADPTVDGLPPLDEGETIATSQWFAFEADGTTTTTEITIDDPADSKTDTTTTFWLSGGVLNNNYIVTNRIVTSSGRRYDRSIKFKIRLK